MRFNLVLLVLPEPQNTLAWLFIASKKYSADRLKAGLNRRMYQCFAWRGYPGQARKSAVKYAIIITGKYCIRAKVYEGRTHL